MNFRDIRISPHPLDPPLHKNGEGETKAHPSPRAQKGLGMRQRSLRKRRVTSTSVQVHK